jgi:hypothetical protein
MSKRSTFVSQTGIGRVFLGIDPGVSGALAAVDSTGGLAYIQAMPDSETALWEAFGRLAAYRPRAILERVRSSPVMGRASAFTFGAGYGALRMGLVAAGIPFEEVSPVTWQRVMGVLVPGKQRPIDAVSKDKKNAHKARASELFPTITMSHTLADALLLAEYLRRMEVRDGAGR